MYLEHLTEQDKARANLLLETYKKYMLNAIKSTNENTRRIYRSKAITINEVSIEFYNINLEEE